MDYWKSNLVSKQQLSKLLEHEDEANDKDNKKLDFVQCLQEYAYHIFLVSEDVLMDVEQLHYSNYLQCFTNYAEFGHTVDHVFIEPLTHGQVYKMSPNSQYTDNIKGTLKELALFQHNLDDQQKTGNPEKYEVNKGLHLNFRFTHSFVGEADDDSLHDNNHHINYLNSSNQKRRLLFLLALDLHLLLLYCLALHLLDVGLGHAHHDQVGKDVAEYDGRTDEVKGCDVGVDVVGKLTTDYAEVSVVNKVIDRQQSITNIVECHQVELVVN